MARLTHPRIKDMHRYSQLRITFANDTVYTVDFKALFADSPGLARLRDPEAFAKAIVDP